MQQPHALSDTDAFLRSASVELPPRADPRDLDGRFSRGTEVYIAYLPADDPRRIVEAAAAVRRAGYRPVPHVAAHEIPSEAALDDFLGRLVGEAAVERVLLMAGDASVVRGPYPTSTALLGSGAFRRHGIGKVDVAGYPEGNAHFTSEVGIEVLAEKMALAEREGLDLGVVSQFCFNASLVVDWLRAIEQRGLHPHVRIGIAGPATLPTLMKFALRCGIGNSMQALRPNIGRFGRLHNDTGPKAVVEGIVHALPALVRTRLEGFHFFAFGGLKKAGDWITSQLRGLPAAEVLPRSERAVGAPC